MYFFLSGLMPYMKFKCPPVTIVSCITKMLYSFVVLLVRMLFGMACVETQTKGLFLYCVLQSIMSDAWINADYPPEDKLVPYQPPAPVINTSVIGK